MFRRRNWVGRIGVAIAACPLIQIMTTGTNSIRSWGRDTRSHLGRVLWTALLAIHVGAVPAALSRLALSSDATLDAYSVFRFGGLLLAATFCLLKIADVAWLRIRPGWRGAVSMAVVVALLHAGALERAQAGDVSLTPSQVGVFLFVGTGLNLDRVRRSIRILVAELRAAHDRGAQDRPPSGAAYASAPIQPPIDLDRLTSPLAPRPPPPFPISLVS